MKINRSFFIIFRQDFVYEGIVAFRFSWGLECCQVEEGAAVADRMAAGSRYGITLKELRELMEFRGAEGVEKLKEYGGAQGLAKKLNTSDSTGKTKFYETNLVCQNTIY